MGAKNRLSRPVDGGPGGPITGLHPIPPAVIHTGPGSSFDGGGTVGVGLVRRSAQASAVALGAAIVLLPSSVGRHPAPTSAAPPPAVPRPVDPLALQVMERMPTMERESAVALAAAVREESLA